MGTNRAWPALVPAVMVAVVACGGANFTDLGNAPDASTNGGDGGPPGTDAAAMTDAPNGSGNDARTPPPMRDASTPPPDAPGLADVGGTADGPASGCPDVTGAYSVQFIDNSGCQDLDDNAAQCIRAAVIGPACTVDFVSVALSGGGKTAINGQAAIQSDGSFSNAALREGTVNRTGCTGTWDAQTSTMTVDCGGTGSNQSCVVALTRTKPTCG